MSSFIAYVALWLYRVMRLRARELNDVQSCTNPGVYLLRIVYRTPRPSYTTVLFGKPFKGSALGILPGLVVLSRSTGKPEIPKLAGPTLILIP